jgi:hypothetical protein
MKKNLFILFCLALLMPRLAGAQIVAPQMRRIKYSGKAGTAFCADAGACKVLDAVAGNAGAAAHTFILKTNGFSVLSVQVDFTRNAGTALVLTCTGSLNDGNSYGSIASSNIVAGGAADNAFIETWTTSTTGNYIFGGYDVSRYDYVTCVLAVTSGGASDATTVYAVASVGR